MSWQYNTKVINGAWRAHKRSGMRAIKIKKHRQYSQSDRARERVSSRDGMREKDWQVIQCLLKKSLSFMVYFLFFFFLIGRQNSLLHSILARLSEGEDKTENESQTGNTLTIWIIILITQDLNFLCRSFFTGW